MDRLRTLLVGRAPWLGDLIEPHLSAHLPQFEFSVLASNGPVLAEIEQGGVVGVVTSVLDAEDEFQVSLLLKTLESAACRIPVFVITARHDECQRLRMFKQGATDCTAWPVDLTRLATLIDVFTVRHQRNIGGIAAPKPDSRMPHRTIAGFLFVTRDTRAMYDQIEAAAQSDCTILLTGETGTGKSHAARCIHELSPRRNKPFQVVECGGLSSALLESELFGHQRGSFTGADRNHEGKFAAVEDGTILLDEIDCVPLEAQAKLLRVFEDRVFEAVGSNRTSDFRGRLIAATNQPLDQQVAAKAFRSDLFFRLKVVEFRLPPLRDCPEAIEALAENFLRTFGQRLNRELRGIAPAALEALRAYHWPGNIRELRNTVERVLTLSRRDWLDLPDLPREIRFATPGIRHVVSAEADESRPNELASARERGELHRLLQALSTHDNNRTRAAKELGISRVALYKKLRKFGIQQPLC